MTRTFLTLIATCSLAAPVLAMGDEVVEMDTNGDGVLSIEEVQAVYPDMSSDTFAAIDTDGDGLLNDEEIKAAQQAGLMPAPKEG